MIMKNLIAKIIMIAVVVCTLGATVTGCGRKESTQDTSQKEPETPAQAVIQDFQNKEPGGEYATIEELASTLMDSELIPMDAATMVVEEGYLSGFTDEIKGFQEGVMFGPVIGTIPFVGYVFELEDAADADAFIEQLKGSADLAWNVCTQADEMAYAKSGNKVCFVMAPLSFEQNTLEQ